MKVELEMLLGTLTVVATFLTGDITGHVVMDLLLDVIIGIVVYSLSRLFYFYFECDMKVWIAAIKSRLGRIKSKFKRLNK